VILLMHMRFERSPCGNSNSQEQPCAPIVSARASSTGKLGGTSSPPLTPGRVNGLSSLQMVNSSVIEENYTTCVYFHQMPQVRV
jgi:hypothetical protein